MTLTDYLSRLADEWCAATGRSLVALGTQVVNDGKFFTVRLANGTAPSTRTFERFLVFFRDGANWPDNVIPLAAADLLDRLSAIRTEKDVSSPDNASELIGARP